jgi:epsin
MAEIARISYNSSTKVYQIMDMLEKRLNSKNWRHIHKALKVLDYLLHEGSYRVVIWAMKNKHIVQTLREFQHVESDGRDQGANGTPTSIAGTDEHIFLCRII